MTRTAILTTIFDQPLEVVEDYFNCLQNQTESDFEVLLINDGFEDIESILLKYESLNVKIFNGTGKIPSNRALMIKKAMQLDYQHLIFCDFDDIQCRDRVKNSVYYLEKYDLVVNDLTSFDGVNILRENILSKRISNTSCLSLTDIVNYNFIGFSNTSINSKIIDKRWLDFPEELVAVDWFFFSLILLHGTRGYFTSDAITFYRQHESNVVGINSFDRTMLEKLIKTKRIHYKTLVKYSSLFETRLFDIEKLILEISRDENHLKNIVELNKANQSELFWWELKEENYAINSI